MSVAFEGATTPAIAEGLRTNVHYGNVCTFVLT